MTVSKALIQWLYGYGNIQIDERIETDVLAQQAISYKNKGTTTRCNFYKIKKRI